MMLANVQKRWCISPIVISLVIITLPLLAINLFTDPIKNIMLVVIVF